MSLLAAAYTGVYTGVHVLAVPVQVSRWQCGDKQKCSMENITYQTSFLHRTKSKWNIFKNEMRYLRKTEGRDLVCEVVEYMYSLNL